jgi:hypothetical protein
MRFRQHLFALLVQLIELGTFLLFTQPFGELLQLLLLEYPFGASLDCFVEHRDLFLAKLLPHRLRHGFFFDWSGP